MAPVCSDVLNSPLKLGESDAAALAKSLELDAQVARALRLGHLQVSRSFPDHPTQPLFLAQCLVDAPVSSVIATASNHLFAFILSFH